jgi:hypothetical protein
MRDHVRHSRSERVQPAFEEGHEREPLQSALAGIDDDADEAFEDDLGDVVRLSCPDCGRPITVLAEEETLPGHALCPTPWNPFGLTVCSGSGRAVADARPVDGGAVAGEKRELAVVLTLPAGLDWRTQPFSHVGGPGSRPIRVSEQRLAA